MDAQNPNTVLKVGHDAIRIAESLQSWPARALNRNTFLGHMHGAIGLAYRELHPENQELELKENLAAIEYLRHEADEDLAVAYCNVAITYFSRTGGSPAENIESGIKYIDAAFSMGVMQGEALSQLLLTRANLYLRRQKGSLLDNQETALKNYEQALSGSPPSASIDHSAIISVSLSNLYLHRKKGRHAENVELAIGILTEITKKFSLATPSETSKTVLTSLSNTYLVRSNGFKADNVELALVFVEEAIVYSNPTNATLLEHLGDVLNQRIRGNRQDNLDRARDAYAEAMALSDESVDALRLNFKRHQTLWHIAEPDAGTDNSKSTQTLQVSAPRPTSKEYIARLEKMLADISRDQDPETWAGASCSVGEAILQFGVNAAMSKATFSERTFESLRIAISHFENALEIQNDNFNFNALSSTLDNISSAYHAMFMISTADDMEWKSFEEFWSLGLHTWSDKTLLFLDKSIEFSKRAVDASATTDNVLLHLRMLCALGRKYVERRDWSNAVSYYFAALQEAQILLSDPIPSLLELQGTLNLLSQIAGDGPLAALLSDDWQKAIEIFEASRTQLLARSITTSRLPLNARDKTKLQELRLEIIELEKRLISPMTFDRRSPMESLGDKRLQMRSLLEMSADDFHALYEPLDALKNLVQDGTIVVIPIISQYSGRLIVISNSNNKLRSDIVQIDDQISLESLIKPDSEILKNWSAKYEKFRSARTMQPEWQETTDKLARLVSDAITVPLIALLEEIAPRQDPKLHFVTHYLFNVLPLSISPTGRLRGPLIEYFDISFSPSLKTQRRDQPHAGDYSMPPDSIATVFATHDPEDENSLGFAPIEAQLVKSWVSKVEQLEINSAVLSEHDILDKIDGCEVWHFSAHGTFNDTDPMQSTIALGSSALSLKAIFESQTLRPPRIVVLSACETARSTSGAMTHELIGLPTAFLQLGAEAVIAAQWPVSDIATTFLMGKLYENWFEECNELAQALRAAQFWLRDATRDDLSKKLEDWAQMKRITVTSKASIFSKSGLENMAHDSVPFSHPTFWGAFTIFRL